MFSLLKRSLTVVLALLLVVLLVVQAGSLFVFPVPDSIRWYGDESWLMTEAIATARTGELHHPHALSSTLSEPKGLILINTPWLRTIVYGVPAALAFPNVNPVDVGRVVSFVIGLITLLVLGLLVYRRTRDNTIAISAALVLASSQAYLYASHSARFDILTGLTVLCVAAWISSERFHSNSSVNRFALLTSSTLLLAIGLPVHLYFHLAGLGLLAILIGKQWKRSASWTGILLGVMIASVAAIVIQFVMSGHVSLWNTSPQQAEFADVTRDIPILKLFSLSSQSSVLTKNASLLWHEAPWVFVGIPLLVWCAFVRRSRARTISLAAIATLMIWYFLQRPHPAYLMHVLPLCTFAMLFAIHDLVTKTRVRRVAVILPAVLLAIVGLFYAVTSSASGSAVSGQNKLALLSLTSMIERGADKPLVLVEASANKQLLADTNIRLMTTHFQFFPVDRVSIEQTLAKHGVDYAILFNSRHYPYDRNTIDPLVRTIQARADLVAKRSGAFFDLELRYDEIYTAERPLLDTFLLYHIRK